MKELRPTETELRDLIRCARGQDPADLFLRGGTVLNVYSGELLPANVAVQGRRIAYVGTREDMMGPRTQVLELAPGTVLAPGYIEPHCHPWVVYNPLSLIEAVAPLGTTTVVVDDLVFFALLGDAEFSQLRADLRQAPTRLLWSARLVSQSEMVGEGEIFAPDRVQRLIESDEVVQLAELTRWPLLYEADPCVLQHVVTARQRSLRVDGHTAGCSYEKLAVLAAGGTSACHEAIDREQALDRLRLGLYTMLRHSSLRPDLPDLLRILTEDHVTPARVLMTTDGPSPSYIGNHGFVDHLIATAIAQGVDPVVAYQLATIYPATYFGLDQEVGGIAPGRIADLVLLEALEQPRPAAVIAGGRLVAREGQLSSPLPALDWSAYRFPGLEWPAGARVRSEDLVLEAAGPTASVTGMDLVSTVIARPLPLSLPVRQGRVELAPEEGLLRLALLDRRGKWVSRTVIRGFARDLDGLACSYTTSADLVVLGRDPAAMAAAVARVQELDGGIVLIERGRTLFELPLEIGALMSRRPFAEVYAATSRLEALLAERGYDHGDLLYTLLFLSCDFLPSVRLTSRGLIDVKTGRVVEPSRPLFATGRTG